MRLKGVIALKEQDRFYEPVAGGIAIEHGCEVCPERLANFRLVRHQILEGLIELANLDFGVR